MIATIGENMQLRRVVRWGGKCASYLHMGGRIGVMIEIEGETSKEALADIWKIVNETNRYINEKKPWESDKKEKILYTVLDNLRILSILLYPFVPETAEKITKQLGLKKIGSLKDCKPNLLGKGKINKGEMLFKKAQ